jgi:hypothetical protein
MSVVNWKTDGFDVYIGRHVPDGPPDIRPEQCIYGNPFILHDVENADERARVIRSYEKWLLSPVQRELVQRAKTALPGKVLGCWCKPKPCHGDILLRTVTESQDETEKRRKELGLID